MSKKNNDAVKQPPFRAAIFILSVSTTVIVVFATIVIVSAVSIFTHVVIIISRHWSAAFIERGVICVEVLRTQILLNAS